MNSRTYFAIVLALMIGTSAHANKEVGNGGDGLLIGGKPYLLDLVEVGLEQNPYFDPAVQVAPEVESRLNQVFATNGISVPTRLLAQKLAEISLLSKLSTYSILKVIEFLDWKLVSMDLADIKDEDTAIGHDPKDLVQLAVRRDRRVMISRNWWDHLDDSNKVALLLHETLYAMSPIFEVNGRKFQKSPEVRILVGHIFSPDLPREGYTGLLEWSMKGELLPVTDLRGVVESGEHLMLGPIIWFHPGSGYQPYEIYDRAYSVYNNELEFDGETYSARELIRNACSYYRSVVDRYPSPSPSSPSPFTLISMEPFARSGFYYQRSIDRQVNADRSVAVRIWLKRYQDSRSYGLNEVTRSIFSDLKIPGVLNLDYRKMNNCQLELESQLMSLRDGIKTLLK